MYQQSIIMIFADTGQKKSLFALDLSIKLACGQPFAGFDCVTPAKTWYIDGEIQESITQERMRGFTHDSKFIKTPIYTTTNFSDTELKLSNEEDRELIYSHCLQNPEIEVIIFDNLMSVCDIDH